MRKTSAYNGIILGVLLGVLVWAKTENTALGIVAALAGSVACFLIIRALERVFHKGVDKVTDKLAEKFAGDKTASGSRCPRCGAPMEPDAAVCGKCGTEIKR